VCIHKSVTVVLDTLRDPRQSEAKDQTHERSATEPNTSAEPIDLVRGTWPQRHETVPPGEGLKSHRPCAEHGEDNGESGESRRTEEGSQRWHWHHLTFAMPDQSRV
jgi:hypothetical protein